MPEPEQLDMLSNDVVVVKLDDEVKTGDDAVKDLALQYKELEAKASEQEAARVAAEQREATARLDAAQARMEVDRARTQTSAANLDTITTALAASQTALDGAKRELRAALEAGDLDAQLEAQDKLTQARVDLRTYDEAKTTMEARAKTPSRPSDPVEAYVQGRSEKTAGWLRQHRDFVTDQRKNAKLNAAHHDAVAEGIAPDTPEYFTHVEQFVGIRKAENKEVTEGDNVQRPGAVQTRKPSGRTAAPVNSRGSGGAVADNNEVHLSPGEARAAVDGTLIWNYDDPSGQKKFKKGDVIGHQEMARRKKAMAASGLYDRTFETQ